MNYAVDMIELSARLRREMGRANKNARSQGMIPAVLYGPAVKESIVLMVEAKDFARVYEEAGESGLIKLKIEDKTEARQKTETRVVLIYDIDHDPLAGKPIHIDFYQVKMDETIDVEIPLNFINKSPAVEAEKGVLVKNMQEIEVEALPADLPREIEVDISALKTFEDRICIKDLKVPEGVKILGNPEEVVALVAAPRTEKELADLEQAPIESVAEVAVEEKGKAKEEQSSAGEQSTVEK